MFKKSLRAMLALTALTSAMLVQATVDVAAAAAQPAQFEIMIWGGTPQTPHMLKRAKDGGITIAGSLSTGQAHDGMLDMVQAAGLKAFVWPDLPEVDGLIKDDKISKHPGLAGYLIGSEFNSTALPELAKANELIQAKLPDKIPLMCLFPAFVNPSTVKAASFQEFLDQYVDTVKPSLLCYDQYALMEDGTVDNNYWKSLEVFRAQSIKSDIPFWNVVQAVGHMYYREPNAADFLFQAYTTAAYGGRGIAYFTYRAYPNGNYRGAPVDQFGNETAAWQYMANANNQILALAPSLMKMRSDGVYHFGEVPPDGHGPQADSLIKAIAGNFLVGDFTHEDGSRYVLIVNKDLKKSDIVYPKFNDPAMSEGEKVAPFKGGALIPLDYEERFLSPGQGMLLKLKK